MNEDLTWELRHEADARESRQKALAKARFFWKKDGQVVRSAEFTQSELETECERLCEAGKDITPFALALLALCTSTGPERDNLTFYGQRRRA